MNALRMNKVGGSVRLAAWRNVAHRAQEKVLARAALAGRVPGL